MINLQVETVENLDLRENFRKLDKAFQDLPFITGKWRFIQLTFTTAVTNYKFAHNLPFIPLDVIQTSVIGSPVTFNYSLFDRHNLDITTTGPSVVRALIGSF